MSARHVKLSVAAVVLLGAVACAPHAVATPERGEMAACAPPAERIDQVLAVKIDALVDDATTRGFAGGVTIMRDGVVVYDRTAGSASLEMDIPVTDKTLFQVSSVAKYFTAALVLKAEQEGRVAINESVADIIPNTKIAKRGISLSQLLSHQSGFGSSYVAERESDRSKALAAIDALEIDEKKVGEFRYSNDGFDLLGILLEMAYYKPYEELLHEKIFQPACLKNVGLWSLVDVADPNKVSQPLEPIGDELRSRNYGMLSTAGLLITARELAQYEAALSSGRVLSTESLTELRTPRVGMSLGKATYGAFLTERPTVGRVLNARGAESWGDNAIMNHYLDKNTIVAVVTSRGPEEGSAAPLFRNEISEAIEAMLFGAS